MRNDYLEWVERYRKDGFNIFYQVETWIFKNMTGSKVWREPGSLESVKFLARTSGKGERSTLFHVGSEDVSLLEGYVLLFLGSKSKKSPD